MESPDENKNSVSLLKEFHDRMKKESNIKEPEYNYTQNPIQGFTAICIYSSFQTEGTGNSKKVAQRNAAKKMLLNLDLSLSPIKKNSQTSSRSSQPLILKPTPDVFNNCSNSKELANRFLQKYSNSERLFTVFSHFPPKLEHLEICFSDINFGMKSKNSPKSNILLERRDKEMHPIECFEKVMQEFQIKFFCEPVETDSQLEVFVVLLKIDFHYMVVGGRGTSLHEAVEKACKNGLDTFRLYLK